MNMCILYFCCYTVIMIGKSFPVDRAAVDKTKKDLIRILFQHTHCVTGKPAI